MESFIKSFISLGANIAVRRKTKVTRDRLLSAVINVGTMCFWVGNNVNASFGRTGSGVGGLDVLRIIVYCYFYNHLTVSQVHGSSMTGNIFNVVKL